MTKNILIYCLIFVLTILASCNDFLEESSQDEMIPSTVEDLRSVMYAEAYPYQFNSDCYLPLLTDEIECNGLTNQLYSSAHENGTPIFTFNKEMFDGIEVFPESQNSWKMYYKKIMGCNVIIDHLSEVSGDQKEKNALLGQSLCLRAYYYMKLVLLYGRAYTEEGVDPNVSLGVPLVLKMGIEDEYPVRNTLKEVYDRIEIDLIEAIDLLENNYVSETAFRIGHIAAQALLTRFYLYRGEYEKLIEWATKTIKDGPSLTNLNQIINTNIRIFDPSGSPEVLWVYGGVVSMNGLYYYGKTFQSGALPYSVSKNLINMYDSNNDLRYSSYFTTHTVSSTGYKYFARGQKIDQSTTNNYGERGIRMGEVYINRAEAAARVFKKTGDEQYRTMALDDLNTLRLHRYDTGTYTNLDISDADELLTFCLEERQREMCLEEGLRWYDIKRLGLSVTHEYIDTEGVSTTYVLEAGSNLYALPIPYDAIERNNKLVQNPR